MRSTITVGRRRFIGAAALTVAAAQFSMLGAAHAQAQIPDQTRAGTEITTSSQNTSSFDSIKQINAGLLNVGYAEVGPSNGQPVVCCTAGPMTSTASRTSRNCWHPRATA
jgi:hypothetical protein